MGVMDYSPDRSKEDLDDEDLKTSLTMIWNKLLELEELVRQLVQEKA